MAWPYRKWCNQLWRAVYRQCWKNKQMHRKLATIRDSSGSHICAECGRSFRAAIALFSHTIGHTMQVLTIRTCSWWRHGHHRLWMEERTSYDNNDLMITMTSLRRAAATICPAQACKWWHDIRHVRIWIGHHYCIICMSMLDCQYNQPKRPGDLDLWPLNLKEVSESHVTWATSVPILVFLGLSVLELSS